MKFRPKFRHVRSGLLNSCPVPSMDICLRDLLSEEQWLSTQMGMIPEKVLSEVVAIANAV